MTTFLKFESEAACLAAFARYLVAEPGDAPRMPAYIGTSAVDVVGVIHRPTGAVIDTPTGPVPVLAPLPGWHVNLSGRCPPELRVFVITPPANPSRTFAR